MTGREDRRTRAATPRRTVRAARPVAVAAVLLAALLVPIGCGTSTSSGSNSPDFLFVQTADSATAQSDNGVVTVTLHGVKPLTVYFSDRPDRITGRMRSSDFVDNWTRGGDDSFANNPPNGALDATLNGKEFAVVVELSDPHLDGDTLTYTVKPVEKPSAGLVQYAEHMYRGKLPGRVTDVSLFIDDVSCTPGTGGCPSKPKLG